MRVTASIVLLMSLVVASTGALAGTQDQAVIALHAESHHVKPYIPCSTYETGVPCRNFNTEWPANSSANLFLWVARGDLGPTQPGIAALSCGIQFDPNVVVYSWVLCASGQEFPNDGGNGVWPANLGGNRITWDVGTDCQTDVVGGDGVHALAGEFYVYAYGPGTFSITPNNNVPGGPEYQVGDCDGETTDLTTPFAAMAFQGAPGSNPCEAVPVRAATWGRVKSQY